MTLIVDAGPLVALAERSDRAYDLVRDVLAAEAGPLVIPAPVTAEVDHLLGVRHGEDARRAFIADLAAGRFVVACLEREHYRLVADLEARHRDLRLGLADLSIVVAAHRRRTERVLSFDERHLRVVMPIGGGSFRLLPTDRSLREVQPGGTNPIAARARLSVGAASSWARSAPRRRIRCSSAGSATSSACRCWSGSSAAMTASAASFLSVP